MSGALVQLTEDEFDLISKGRGAAVPPDAKISRDLLDVGLFVADGTDELDILRRRYQRSGEDRQHMAVTVVTSLGCNFKCPYCFESKRTSILHPSVERAFRDYCGRQIANGLRALTIHWMGGEPLLARDRLIALSQQLQNDCEAAGVRHKSDITTNGYLLDAETARRLTECGVEKAQICIDGPPEVHDRMRPLQSGRGTFYRVLANVIRAAEIMDVTIRVNADKSSVADSVAVLQILKEAGLAGKVSVYLGKLTKVDDQAPVPSPSTIYLPSCFTTPEFADEEAAFLDEARRLGFNRPTFPQPMGMPCTAVRPNEFVLGSAGEVYKCWESIGNPRSVLGHIEDWADDGTRIGKWATYDPFSNDECRQCVALPVCMGGCAHHAMSESLYDHRCVTFRYNYEKRLASLLDELVPTVPAQPPEQGTFLGMPGRRPGA